MVSVGDTKTAYNGMEMCIIKYDGYDDVTVQFSDGTVSKTDCRSWESGHVRNKSAKGFTKRFRESYNKYIGKSNGLCTIIEYKGYNNITVEFPDGTKKKSDIKSFNLGYTHNEDVKLLNNRAGRIGKIVTDREGNEAKVIKYTNSRDVTIQYADGSCEVRRWTDINSGNFTKQKMVSHVGETKTMNCGEEATIIHWYGDSKCRVRFTDTDLEKDVDYFNFSKGNVSNSTSLTSVEKIAELMNKGYITMKNGARLKVLDSTSLQSMNIEFEDGTVRKDVSYNNIKSHIVGHPTLDTHLGKGNMTYSDFSITNKAYIRNKENLTSDTTDSRDVYEVYYTCRCKACGYSNILTPSEMVEHKRVYHSIKNGRGNKYE